MNRNLVGSIIVCGCYKNSLKIQKVEIRSRNWKDRQYKCQKKKERKVKNSIDKIQYRKLKIERHKLHQKTKMN